MHSSIPHLLASEMPGRSQDLVIEALAYSEQELLAHCSDLQRERDSYRSLLRLALCQLFRLARRLDRTQASLRRLLEIHDDGRAVA